MPQLEHIEAIEKRLWSAADTLRANSSCADNEFGGSLGCLVVAELREGGGR
jgi:hypothetical protein